MLTVRALTLDDWPVVERLFGPRGACGGCWCMAWRVPHGGKLWKARQGEPNRRSLCDLVTSGRQHAVMAFDGEESAGWCAFGPRSTYPRLETVRAFRREWGPDTWSVVCFYIPPRWRRRGVGGRLLEAATARAFALGAREIEGYPVVTAKSLPGPFVWTGLPSMFAAAGYRALPAEGRPVYLISAPGSA
jgi:GNAT superfamily N-acetyltransferase